MRPVFYSFILAAILFSLPVTVLAGDLSYADGDVVSADTAWDGRIEVEGIILVPSGVTLTVMPGTTVAFKRSESSFSDSGEADVLIPGSGIRVEGTLVAAGTRDKPIVFTSAEQSPAPGDWGCLFFDHSKENVFKHCVFEYSTYTVHAHFSWLTLSRCLITRNIDGSRMGFSRADYSHCDITGNTGKGLNFYQSKNTVRYCNITENHEGLFLNSKDTACVIENNNIHSNKGRDLRMGEFHDEDVALAGNYWGTTDPDTIRRNIYDRHDDPEIGEAMIRPAAAEIIGAGIDGLEASLMWEFLTGGFVDSSPAVSGGKVYFGSWDRHLYCLSADSGELEWSFETGDCVDSSPAVSDGKVYFGSWDRNVYCLDTDDGKVEWKFEMPPSNFDDHRQSSPAISPFAVHIGGFNGYLYSLDKDTGRLINKFITGGPVRGRPFISASRYMKLSKNRPPTTFKYGYVGSEGGKLYAFNLLAYSRPVWEFKAGSAVNSSPVEAKGRVYFGSRDGKVHCLDWQTGKEIWSFQTGGRIEYSSPLFADGKVIIGSCDGILYALDSENGSLSWTFNCGSVIYSSPLFLDGKVVFGDNDGGIHFLDIADGLQKGVFMAKGPVQALSSGPDGTVYAGSRDGYLYAISTDK